MMSRAQERIGRSIARAIRGIEYSTRLIDGRRVDADLTDDRLGAVPRVEVRHPNVERNGFLWLVAIVVLDPAPRVTYAVPVYRAAIKRAVARVLAVQRAA